MLESQREIEAAGKAFEDLAHQTDAILGLAAGVIGCVEDKSVHSILPKVQSLGVEVRSFIEEKLRATTGILETAMEERTCWTGSASSRAGRGLLRVRRRS